MRWEMSPERWIVQRLVRGEFPKHALRAVLEWADLHQTELMQDWILASVRKTLMQKQKNVAA